MKILLDECTPHVLKRLLTGFEIRCSDNKRSEPEVSAEAIGIAISSYSTPTNQVPLVASLAPEVNAALQTIRRGELIQIRLPS